MQCSIECSGTSFCHIPYLILSHLISSHLIVSSSSTLYTFSVDKYVNSIFIRIIVDHIDAAHLAYPIFMSIFFLFSVNSNNLYHYSRFCPFSYYHSYFCWFFSNDINLLIFRLLKAWSLVPQGRGQGSWTRILRVHLPHPHHPPLQLLPRPRPLLLLLYLSLTIRIWLCLIGQKWL